ncbi:carboxypeptidase regulatory-like domain-containing protein [uncultured Psychroserpens sp.]|uniref:carboxypeptidase regulatory-like domain-containing protein n=1 Tax=uncultured Psychroserpens sp. TaxID=255436 RepID=UPI00261A64D7|nr:carboxypeptidase regulatory-like domain-containing protein [uncultured Psychroserpens sp.]
MRTLILMAFTLLFSVVSAPTVSKTNSKTKTSDRIDKYNKSGLEFYVHDISVNTKYTEYAATTFRNKLIMVSSKKIGGLGNGIDKNTNEPFTELFCLDIDGHGNISNPLLFSRIINTKANEGQVSFSPDEKTMYFTRSTRENSKNYKLYKTSLKENSNGNWINEQELPISNDKYSIENPHVTRDGKLLYFSSNMPGSIGGYDIYVAKIKADGSIGEPQNLGTTINTLKDEKFPYTSTDSKKLFISSNGHETIGGFDIFVSSIVNKNYKSPRNLGAEVNSTNDEIAFVFIDKDTGFFSSNKKDGLGSFDLYRFKANAIYQQLQGIVVSDKNQPLSNATVVLLDEEGNEIERQTTDIDAHYSFKVKAFENYSVKALKEGFNNFEFAFTSQKTSENVYRAIVTLTSKEVKEEVDVAKKK